MNKQCRHFGVCSCCSELKTEYSKQLKQKKERVEASLAEWGIKSVVSDTVGMYYPYAYRNKLHLKASAERGKPKLGFVAESGGDIVEIKECPLHGDWAAKLAAVTNEFLSRFEVEVYDEISQQGILRYVTARYLSGAILVTLVVTTQNFPGRAWLYGALKEEFKNVSLYLNINKRTDNAVYDKTFIHKSGDEFLSGAICGVKFDLHPAAFFQVNAEIAAKVYRRVLEEFQTGLGGIKDKNILDLYSGIGITSALFALNGAKVTSIESVPQAVAMAKRIMKRNGVADRVNMLCGDCAEGLKALEQNFDAVFLDPARLGADEETLKAISAIAPEQIIYLSCNPDSLAKNLKLLSANYEIQKIIPYDMFPQTDHVETLVCLKKSAK